MYDVPDLPARIDELVNTVGMSTRLHSRLSTLSRGMQQRVAIARALALDARILLMDEPFGALDEQTRTKMGHELLDIWEKTHKTILFITHSLTEALFLSDRVLVMSHRPGRIVEEIPVDLPRPRTYDMIGSESFGRARNRIWQLISETEDDTTEGPGL